MRMRHKSQQLMQQLLRQGSRSMVHAHVCRRCKGGAVAAADAGTEALMQRGCAGDQTRQGAGPQACHRCKRLQLIAGQRCWTA